MKEYIIHGTYEKNLKNILKDGYINSNVKKKHLTMLKYKSSNQIFTQLLYRDLPNEDTQIPHYGMCALVLDKVLLKDFPFYATYIGGFLDKFNNAFSEEKDSKESKNILAKGSGNLTRIPHLKKLRNNIETIMDHNTYGNISFMYSCEIIFDQKIPLKKYCKYILYSGSKIPDNIIKSALKLKIPIKSYNPELKQNYGLNNFIDLIEKN